MGLRHGPNSYGRQQWGILHNGGNPDAKSKEDEVLNYFVNRATNAAAESLNSKMKGFRSAKPTTWVVPQDYKSCPIFYMG